MTTERNHRYLDPIINELVKEWPYNRTINIVCHGHSVPCGYTTAPLVEPFNAYPHLLHKALKEIYPCAVINVITTSIGGEHSASGSERFIEDVLCHKPDLITIDYGLNDRQIGLDCARESWSRMIEHAIQRGIKLILLTPSWDLSYETQNEDWQNLVQHAKQIRDLADHYKVGLADTFEAYETYLTKGGKLKSLLSSYNHPSREGHDLITRALMKWF